MRRRARIAAGTALAIIAVVGMADRVRAHLTEIKLIATITNHTNMTGSASLHGETTQTIRLGEEYRHTSHWSIRYLVGGRGYHLWLDFGDAGKCLITVEVNNRNRGNAGSCSLLSDQSWGNGFRCGHEIEFTDVDGEPGECRVRLAAR